MNIKGAKDKGSIKTFDCNRDALSKDSAAKKVKYDSEYIAYVNRGESAAVFVVRDIAAGIDLRGKWIDILNFTGYKTKSGRWNFKQISIELYPRLTRPVYPAYASEEDKKYITWKAAYEDIMKQKRKHYKGPRYNLEVRLKELYSVKNGKTECKYEVLLVIKV